MAKKCMTKSSTSLMIKKVRIKTMIDVTSHLPVTVTKKSNTGVGEGVVKGDPHTLSVV